MSDKDMATVYERRDGSKPKLWTVYVDLGWIVFFAFCLAVGVMSKNLVTVIIQGSGLLLYLGLIVWELNHLTWVVTDYHVRIGADLAKEAVSEQGDK